MARVEINNEKDFERWLNGLPEDQQRQAAIVIASRAAMRVIPILANWLKEAEEEAIVIFLAVFRSCYTSYAISKNNEIDERIERVLESVVEYADAAKRIAPYERMEAVAISAVSAAQVASVILNFNDGSDVIWKNLLYLTIKFLEISIEEIEEKALIWKGVREDAAIISKEGCKNIFGKPLWEGSAPKWAIRLWENLRHDLVSRDGEYWEVWTDWYDVQLDSSKKIPCYNPPIKELEIARIMLPNFLWFKGPATATSVRR